MSFKKKIAIAVAAGALAAISVPAMALENEFHGSYGFNATFSNFQDGGSGDFFPGVAAYGKKRKMNNYFEQRARIQYTAKANDDLKLVTHFEIDNRFGVTRAVGAGSGSLDTDSINLETKHVYLDFNLGQNFNVKTGMQPYKDTIKGLFIDADVPMIYTTTKLGNYKLGLGFSRFDDDAAAGQRLGEANKDLFVWDNSIALGKDVKAALSYYFLADYATGTTGSSSATLLDLANVENAILLHTLGLSGEAKVGPATLSGFVAMQAGHQKQSVGAGAIGTRSSRQFHGYAANVAAKVAVGPGTAKVALLYTSGDNSTQTPTSSHYKGWVTSSVNTYNESGMMIIARNTANSPTSTDRYIRRNVTNIALATMGYDAALTDKLYVNGNVGFGFAPSSYDAPLNLATAGTPRNQSDFMGTEINLETGYKVYTNLTLRAQAAYMILGGYYKNSTRNSAGTPADPENPYTARLLASFAF